MEYNMSTNKPSPKVCICAILTIHRTEANNETFKNFFNFLNLQALCSEVGEKLGSM